MQAGENLSASSWPLKLPGTGAQSEVTLNVPYRFFGLTQALSWLAQFAGQGFGDISALANLILLQEMIMGEEYMMLAGTSTPVAAPSIVSASARAAGSKERTVGAHASFAVIVTATNYYGETVGSPVLVLPSGTTSAQVVDVTIGPSPGRSPTTSTSPPVPRRRPPTPTGWRPGWAVPGSPS
ncbi:hypothetical protein, partial [Streptomyces lavendulae]|uniref:hypothetical protein n=1 Tax=Streptomyces lavendulae TaxID=1914 RepID=UPI0031EA2F9A